jgi:uncharacterized protein YraI
MNRVKQIACAVGAASILALSASAASAAPARAVTDLNVRSGESTAYPVIAVMPAGEPVTVTGCGDGWCYVQEYDGFASADYLDVAGVVYGAPPPVYVAPAPPAVVVTEPAYRRPAYRFGNRVIRRGIRQFRRELRRERRQDARQERRMERREARQERREDRREARQERRRDRR